MTPFETLNTHGAVLVKDAVSKELREFFTHVLLRASKMPTAKIGDIQIPTAKVILDHEVVFETFLEKFWPHLEDLLGIALLPTYAYARLYSNGDVLEKHIDRPVCEISVTIQLGRSHHYAWPIYMGGKRYDLAEGDAVIYKGSDIEHWRDVCDGPEDYYSGQVFLHFVCADGPHADTHIGDKTFRKLWPDMFVKCRQYQMETK